MSKIWWRLTDTMSDDGPDWRYSWLVAGQTAQDAMRGVVASFKRNNVDLAKLGITGDLLPRVMWAVPMLQDGEATMIMNEHVDRADVFRDMWDYAKLVEVRL